MTSRDSMMVWLPKELYGSVEPIFDQRFIWCPMPFDESLPVEQTSFIHMEGEDDPDKTDPVVESALPPAPAAADVYPEPIHDLSSSETDPEREFLPRQISQNLGRARRRPRKTSPGRNGHVKGGRDGRSRGFGVRLGLNLDIEVTLKARISGDLELSACFDDL